MLGNRPSSIRNTQLDVDIQTNRHLLVCSNCSHSDCSNKDQDGNRNRRYKCGKCKRNVSTSMMKLLLEKALKEAHYFSIDFTVTYSPAATLTSHIHPTQSLSSESFNTPISVPIALSNHTPDYHSLIMIENLNPTFLPSLVTTPQRIPSAVNPSNIPSQPSLLILIQDQINTLLTFKISVQERLPVIEAKINSLETNMTSFQDNI